TCRRCPADALPAARPATRHSRTPRRARGANGPVGTRPYSASAWPQSPRERCSSARRYRASGAPSARGKRVRYVVSDSSYSAADGEPARERRGILLRARVTAGGARRELAELGKQLLGLVLARCRLAAGPTARLLQRRARLRRNRRRPRLRRRLEILDRLRTLAEIEKGEAAPVEALRVDLRHLVDEQELREPPHRLLQQILLACRV